MANLSNSLKNRTSFASVNPPIDFPDLLDIQLSSMKDFLQEDILPEKRKNVGLEQVFQNIFPIEDNHKNYILEYKYYYLGLPKYTVKECLERRISYSIPLKVKFVLHITDENDKSKFVQSIEQDVFFGNIPYMTESGTFIINGAERVIVSQLQRSPGVFFDQSIHPNGTKIFQARIIPFRGSWVDFTTDIYDCIYAIIDRRRKFPASLLLRAIGFSTDLDIYSSFGLTTEYNLKKDKKIIIDKHTIQDILNPDTGEIIIESDTKINEIILNQLLKNKIHSLFLLTDETSLKTQILKNTFEKDPTSSRDEALLLLYSHLRTGDAPNVDVAAKFIEKMFFSTKKYDLGAVGRYRINKKFGLEASIEDSVLTVDDFIEVFKYLISMRNGEKGTDDIDHLGNRRVRTVGEQLANQFNIALSRMHRNIRDRMNQREAESLTPQDLVNSRIITTVLNTFFGTSQLSQFMDQTNPLAEVTHKRRISSLGPGGLSRERAGFEVRDVHHTHYGRLCPIETPEGPNIGLINSLATYAKVNKLGFIESPYRLINNAKSNNYEITNDVAYLSPDEEDRAYIAEATESLDKKKFTNQYIRSRHGEDFPIIKSTNIDYMDVSAHQIVSVSASLIPFLENDDANRALMGSNMMRQSVPLMRPESPIVGTGMEKNLAKDSRSALYSKHSGVVEYVDSKLITLKANTSNVDLEVSEDHNIVHYNLKKFLRTNQNTCVNQVPRVSKGDKIKNGDLLADGHSTNNGELSLGRNLKVAYMPWRGYNFEDAIIINERLMKEDTLTSVHIKEFEVEIRDTKRGEEELTNEIPNVSEEATRNLDDLGIVRIGASVHPGDILVGKVTPKGETEPSPEEKLLRAIFGDKAGDVKDASRRCDSGVHGTVVETQLFQRKSSTLRLDEKRHIRELQKNAREQRVELMQTEWIPPARFIQS